MSSIDFIREQLKKFEENIKNREGIEHLCSALEEIAMILQNSSSDEKERSIVQNILHNYRNRIIEMARTVCSDGTPSSDELLLIVELMGIFKENGIIEEPDFKDAYGKTVVLWLETGKMEAGGEKLDDSLKKGIYDDVTKNFEVI